MNLPSSMKASSPKRVWLMRAIAAAFSLAVLSAVPTKAEAGVFIGVSVGFPPPLLPVYVQPPIPGPGYIWTPGYWAWNGDGYYWVPGTWVVAPFYGALWTPPYWGWAGSVYMFHPGYWGYHVGYYGGIDYGCGYAGVGYVGGYWGHGGFYYNRAVNQINNVHITNVYNRTVINNNTFINRTSYNGGQGGLTARPTPQEMAYAHQQRFAPVAAQQQQMKMASQNQALRASFNHGAPPIAATAQPGMFHGQGVMAARGAIGRFTPAAASVQPFNNHAMQPQSHDNMALRSANFAPHANTAFAGNPRTSMPNVNPGADSRRFNQDNRVSTGFDSRAMPADAARTAYTPHAAPLNAYRPQPATVDRSPTSYQPQSRYQAQSRYQPQPVYQPQPRYQAQPQYHPLPYHAQSYRAAPRPSGYAPHPSGGHRAPQERDSKHG